MAHPHIDACAHPHTDACTHPQMACYEDSVTLSPSHTLPRAHRRVWRVASPLASPPLPTVASGTFIVKASGLSHVSVSFKPHLWLPRNYSYNPSLWFWNLLHKCGPWPVFRPQLSAGLSLHFSSKFSFLSNLSTSLLSIALREVRPPSAAYEAFLPASLSQQP